MFSLLDSFVEHDVKGVLKYRRRKFTVCIDKTERKNVDTNNVEEKNIENVSMRNSDHLNENNFINI